MLRSIMVSLLKCENVRLLVFMTNGAWAGNVLRPPRLLVIGSGQQNVLPGLRHRCGGYLERAGTEGRPPSRQSCIA